MFLKLDQIRLDGNTQSRAELNQQTVSEYAEVASSSESRWPFDKPVVVFHDGSHYWLADGFHRWHGLRESGRDEAKAEVKQGSARDAFVFAAAANTSHGLRRTNRDKRFVVARFLNDPTWGRRSDRWIAEKAMVSDHLVADIRRQVAPTANSRSCEDGKAGGIESKDGKTRRRPKRKQKTPPPIIANPDSASDRGDSQFDQVMQPGLYAEPDDSCEESESPDLVAEARELFDRCTPVLRTVIRERWSEWCDE